MTRLARLPAALRRHLADETGATLVEFAIVLTLFLLIFFGLIDFGRLAFHYVTSERAVFNAARVAAVRPPVCDSVPETNDRGATPSGSAPPKYGTLCSAGGTVCASPGPFTCRGDQATTADGIATAQEAWRLVRGTLPSGATIANLRFTYTSDPNLGFLGGPYVPMVSVEIDNGSGGSGAPALDFHFISPLAGLVRLAGGTAPGGLGADLPYPSMKTTIPGEDLAQGTSG